MSEASPEHSHAATWNMVRATVLPLIYLPGCGPLLAWTKDSTFPAGWPDWVYLICRPITWLRSNTPMEGPLGSYYDWWVEK